MKNIFFLLIIAYQALFYTNPLHASCNQSNDSNVFKIHGKDKDNKAVIEGECLNELLTAMGNGKNIDIEYAEIKGGIDFTNPDFFPARSFKEIEKDLSPDEIAHYNHIKKFPGDEKIVLVKGDIRITWSIIEGKITIHSEEIPRGVLIFKKGVNFHHTRFAVGANFESAQFDGGADFESAQFAKGADFRSARFAGEANFRATQFDGGVDFGSAKFAGGADFGAAQFADCSFNSAMFGIKSAYTAKYPIEKLEWMTFEKLSKLPPEVKFPEDLKDKISYDISQQLLIFKRIMSEEEKNKLLNLSQDVPYKEAIKELFRGSQIKEATSSFSNAIFTKFADFRNARFFGDVDFKEAKFKEVGLFDGCSFFNARELGLVDENNPDSLVDLNMDNSYFNLLKGLSFDQVFPHLHKRLEYGKVKDEQGRQSIIDIYIYLQENFRKIGRFEDADKIYYERRVLEADKETCPWNRMWNWVLEVTCNYGTNFTHIFITCGSLIAIFTVLYFLTVIPYVQKSFGNIKIHDDENDKIKWPNRLWHAFYISVNSFTTLGTGDITITRYFRALVILEGALGWFMLGLFIVVFAAQYIR